jgi:hypothetical protein
MGTFFNVVWYLIQEREFCQFILTCLFLAKVMKVPVLRSKFVSFGSFLHSFVLSDFEKIAFLPIFIKLSPKSFGEDSVFNFSVCHGSSVSLKGRPLGEERFKIGLTLVSELQPLKSWIRNF